ncbi:4Fe-4S binding protein [Adlercreutzia faecimuris]|uniref:4Fe-4S binding protein n=1 Tax=Adlercreutzia faecimuris TaxID=2897341 RepID=A0ABS9WJ29_9ACTN|nr:4Fe-4S binding protein [Adlercreutzia sp. JBNU-10]MCI2242879.1 4Fe-4S binding protein [Adlercreutzia sp. JBNU-10]
MKMRMATARTLAACGVLGLVGVGLALHTGTGTPSAWGLPDIAAICPLGAVEAAIASKTVVPPLLIGLAIVVALVAVFGRAFCAWGCPVPLLRRVFGRRSRGSASATGHARPAAGKPAEDAASGPAASADSRPALPARVLDVAPSERGSAADPRNWVLGATVLTTAAFGFPVFCLVCPVGLTVATFIGLWRLLQFSETTLSLVVFPLILVVELVLLRKWCHRFCPLGALLALMARLNRTLRPTVDASACVACDGSDGCGRCAEACPEGIDLHHPAASAPMGECTKCGECGQACPVHAISFPFLPRRSARGDGEGEEILAEAGER